MTKIKLLFLAILLISGSLLFLPHLPKPAYSQVSPSYGEPLQGLTDEELRLFRIGQEDFEEIREINDGLGPGFNARSCAECHSTPATGGASAMSVVRFGSLTGEVFDGLESLGGSLLQLFAIRTRCQARIPPQANVIARRLTLPIFGDGLIESIPDDDILATAKSQTEDMRGRAHLINDLATKTRRVGRFGWKAVHATLLSFSADAYLNEMGITSRFLPDDRPPNGDMVLLAECDLVPDPEDRFDPAVKMFSVDKFANYMRLLAPPARGPSTSGVTEGEKLFSTLQCSVCHKPSYTTGPSPITALDRQPVNAYSDFLLHYVGTRDLIQQGDAGLYEFRTPPLWGLRARGPYLHDGTAVTVDQAILRHDIQALSSRSRYEQLSTEQRQALLAFLNSL